MIAARGRWWVGAALMGLCLAACQASGDEPGTTTGGAAGVGAGGSAGSAGGGASGGAAGSGSGGTTGGSTGNATGGGSGAGGAGQTRVFPPGGPGPEQVPIRRLTNAEYAASLKDLFPGFEIAAPMLIQDSKVLGFLNLSSSQSSSSVRMEQYEAAAQQVSKQVAADPTKLTGCNAATRTEATCAQTYLADLGRRAFRRPLSEPEKQAIYGLLNVPVTAGEPAVDYSTRLAMAVEGVLLSPKFLFRPEIGGAKLPNAATVSLTPWELATRLSYLVTGSLPDAPLAASADAGTLASPTELTAQAQRLLGLSRSRENLVKFHTLWLGTDTVSALSKSTTVFPTFSSARPSYFGSETSKFLDDVLFAKGGTFADLFLANYTFVNADLAGFYGVAAPAVDWSRVELNPAQRSGLLTQGSLLATMAKENATDPVRRGKFVLERLLCRSIDPPPPEIVARFQPLDLSKTAREQFTQHRSEAVCNACHRSLDPLGLPFEHYDATGQWRDNDRGMALDVTGDVDGVKFDGVPALAKLLVEKEEARTCYLSQWFRFANGRLNGDADQDFLTWMTTKFARDTKVTDMVVSLVQSDSFRNLKIDSTIGSAP